MIKCGHLHVNYALTRLPHAGTNHFGHFALTRELLPSMRKLVRHRGSLVTKQTCHPHVALAAKTLTT